MELPLYQEQLRFLQSDAPFRAFVGGRGAGKTHVGALDVALRASLEANARRTYLVASPTAVLLHDTTYPAFQALAGRLGIWNPRGVRLSPYPTVRLRSGAVVRFRTAEDPEKLRGPNLSGVWLDEASLMDGRAFLLSLACLREDGAMGWLSATFTPKGLSHWTYQLFGDAQAQGPELQQARGQRAVFHATTADNPFNPPEFAGTLSLQYGAGLFADQELGGHFVAVEGAEWPGSYFPASLWFADWPLEPWVCSAMALDPSKGRRDRAADPERGRRADFSAYVWGGADRRGHVWVDADLDQERDVTTMVQDGIAHFRAFSPQALVIEVNQFQEMLAPEFQRQASALSLPPLPLWGFTNVLDKKVRIRATVGPYLARSQLHVRDSPGGRLLVGQLRDFPQGQKDDGPDALDMLLRMLLELFTGQGGTSSPRRLRV
jgi:phage terminase large subunit-like protein